jgi:large subunit ribosomal protein L35
LQSATEATTSSPPPPPAAPKDASSGSENAIAADSVTAKPTSRTPNRRRRRPNISLANPRTWNRPVPEGFIPAYDEALKFIQQDSAELKQELEGLRTRIQALQAKGGELQDLEAEELEALRKKADIVEVQSEINLPDVRWYFANGMGELVSIELYSVYSSSDTRLVVDL